MIRAYIVVIALCLVLGFLFTNQSLSNNANHCERSLCSLAVSIGVTYAFAGTLVGWHFVRDISASKGWLGAFLIATPVHIVSTFVVCYVCPSIIFILFNINNTGIGILVTSFFGLLSFVFGIPQVLIDFFLLRWLFRLPLRKQDLRDIFLWKSASMLICSLILFCSCLVG